jgi:phage repressor protein C with HTH and peptisase S24 domain
MKSGNAFENWLVRALGKLGYTNGMKRSRAMGWSSPMQYNLEKGLRFPSSETIADKLRKLKMPEEEIQRGIDLLDATKAAAKARNKTGLRTKPSNFADNGVFEVPVLAKIPFGTDTTSDTAQYQTGEKVFMDAREYGEKRIAIEVTAGSCSCTCSEIRAGDILIVERSSVVPPQDGEICLVEWQGAPEQFVRLVRRLPGGSLSLECPGEMCDPIIVDPKKEKIGIIGRVRRIIRHIGRNILPALALALG